ncbi:RimJ/RimL family protein N-acetyltransferase [Granulicella aggregans]|uniref:RimJ/RimL family protein N-acetyltransferase n=1 Tax=Granulicella aggregans TaxID=474949 RepID=A0A7W7ZB31_9BACT|nr:GNAT family N-acetyltransferase [Granulicella aggregans]MBB5056620.1 RimJ/RimL family protein N-acetyltransferase [Granulicella aggregans]
MLKESPAPVIETERLRLRGHREDDLANCVAMWSEEAVTRFTVGRQLTEEEIWMRMIRHVGHWVLKGYGYWIIEEKSTGVFLGEAGIAEFHRGIKPSIVGTPEAGWVFSPAAHGKGYGFEAASAFLAWGETHFGSLRSVCIIAPENASSLRLAAKLGYAEEARTEFHGKPAILLGRGHSTP